MKEKKSGEENVFVVFAATVSFVFFLVNLISLELFSSWKNGRFFLITSLWRR
jgi:hypothetical protein